jgi:branched-chain amino acid transport system permease protein
MPAEAASKNSSPPILDSTADQRRPRRRSGSAIIALGIIILLAVPVTGNTNPYTLNLYGLVCIYAIVAMGLNLLLGYTGQISLGHAAYFAVGAYTSALLTTDLGYPFVIAIFAAVCLTAFCGLLVGIPSLKLEGPYLAMATIGFGEIVKMTLVNWETVTHGPVGLSRIAHPSFFGYELDSPTSMYYFVASCAIVAFFIYYNLIRSHYGKTFLAVRDSVKAAAAMGVNVRRVKVIAFVFSTAFAGLAGALYAHLNRYIAPDAFGFGESINFLIIVVVGGMGTIAGPIAGALIIVYLREWLQVLSDANMLIYGLLLMVLMVFIPRGTVGTILEILEAWRRTYR